MTPFPCLVNAVEGSESGFPVEWNMPGVVGLMNDFPCEFLCAIKYNYKSPATLPVRKKIREIR